MAYMTSLCTECNTWTSMAHTWVYIWTVFITSYVIVYHVTGSRSALLNMEARGMAASMLNRKCVFIKWAELSSDLFQDLLNRGAGSLIIILPSDWSHESNETIAVCT